MRAWSVAAFGDPRDVCSLVEADIPVPSGGQLLVRVGLSSMNFPDDLMIRGRYQVKPPLPFTPGHEVLGTVVERGPDATIAVGSRGVGLTAWPSGGFAEYALVDEADFFSVPDDVPDAVGASMLITYQTAHVALHHRANIAAGDTLLVHAGAGGVGSAAIELGVAAGATVIATAGSEDKVRTCMQLGASVAINYSDEDFVSIVHEVTGGRGADIIYDPVGGDVLDRSRKCIAWEGRLLVIGFAGGRIADVPTNHLLLKNYSIVGVHWGAYRDHDVGVMRRAHASLIELHRAGFIHPIVGETAPLEHMMDALERLVARGTVGKVLIAP